MAQLGNDNRSKWDPAFCKQLIEHMAAGCSFATFGAVIGVRYSTLQRWKKMFPEWLEASELGELFLMYTWEKIIIGQANGSVKGLPATTIFALKNYFPDKFKENMSLAGGGNTIVVFDSGVPIKADVIETKKSIDAVSYEVMPGKIENMPRCRDVSSKEKNKNFLEKNKNFKNNSENSEKIQNLPDFLQISTLTEISEDDI